MVINRLLNGMILQLLGCLAAKPTQGDPYHQTHTRGAQLVHLNQEIRPPSSSSPGENVRIEAWKKK